jgi:purine-binding chemotaxis protein CheW
MNQTTKPRAGAQDRYLSFSLGAERYAIPLLCVKEVIAMPEITSVPFTPPHFLGIMNLRGQVISVMDFRVKLGIKVGPSAETAVIICDLTPICLGVIVDSIDSVVSPKESELADKPEIQSNKSTDYITGIYRREKDLILLLDIAKAMNVEDLRAIANQSQTAASKAA